MLPAIDALLVLALALCGSASGSEEQQPSGHGAQTPAAEAHADHAQQHQEKMVEHSARTSSRDVKLPHALVARIEREYKEYLAKAAPGAKRDEIKRGLINITAELTQRRPPALHENTRVLTPTGGGVVDLEEIVTPLRGAFRVKLLARRENGEALSTSRVFFVSRAKQRILAGENYGAGCDKYMEITSHFRSKWESPGFEVYTADQRFVSVLGGTFLFVDFAPERLSVGGITFTDSRYPGLLCE